MSAPDGADIVAQLVQLRIQRRLTQQDIADRVGVDRTTITRFETDSLRRRTPSLHIVTRYAQAVGARLELTAEETPCTTA